MQNQVEQRRNPFNLNLQSNLVRLETQPVQQPTAAPTDSSRMSVRGTTDRRQREGDKEDGEQHYTEKLHSLRRNPTANNDGN